MRLFSDDPADRAGHTTPKATPPEAVAPLRGPLGGRRDLTLELLEEIRSLKTSTTDGLKGVRGQLLNEVLAVEQVKFDANGLVARDYHATVGSIVVVNLTTTDIVVHASSASSSAPGGGIGVQTVPSGTYLTIPIGGKSFTLYGPTSGVANLQVFTGMQAFGGGSVK